MAGGVKVIEFCIIKTVKKSAIYVVVKATVNAESVFEIY